jgi:alanine racemase
MSPAAPQGTPERIVAAGLPPLAREAWVEVSLDAIEANVRSLRARLPATGSLDVVLKANGYGLGAIELAKASLAAGARAILVATVDEALELRGAGITAPVRVLWRVPPAHLRAAAQAHIGVAATSPVIVDELLAADLRGTPPIEVDIELDSGLGRDGILPEELATQLARLTAAAPRIAVRSIWSHLANAENVELARAQQRLLAEQAEIMPGVEQHLVASGGLLTVGDVEQVARIGIALLGVVPNALRGRETAASLGLTGAYQLIARPVRIAVLPKGHGVGYGPAFVADRPSRIITLPIGYADGISYHERDKATVLIRGTELPVVGTIAMDSMTIDATDLTASDLTLADDVVFIGTSGSREIQPVDVARRRGTITNEVSTSFSSRLARVYTRGGVPVAVRSLLLGGR